MKRLVRMSVAAAGLLAAAGVFAQTPEAAGGGAAKEAGAKASKADGQEAPAREAVITAERIEFDNKEGVILFDENVVVDVALFVMRSDRLLVFMEGTNDVKQILAVGRVSITNLNRSASCDKAVYTKKDGQIVMTGSARLMRQGDEGGDLGQEASARGRHQPAQGRTLDELGDDVGGLRLGRVDEVEDLDDAGVPERGHRVGLAAEAFGGPPPRGVGHAYDLERDVAAELRIVRPKDRGHGPVAERRQDAVASQRGPDARRGEGGRRRGGGARRAEIAGAAGGRAHAHLGGGPPPGGLGSPA